MEVSEEIYEHLLKEINEQDVSIFEGILYEAKDPKVFLEKSKLLPFGKRILKITRDRPFKESVLNLVEGKIYQKENFSIEKPVKQEIESYGHNYLEKIPANWKEMNPYIAERVSNIEGVPKNIDRGIYGGVYDFLDVIQSLSENNLNTETLQTLYQIGKRFVPQEKEKNYVKKENNPEKFQEILGNSIKIFSRYLVKDELNKIIVNYVKGFNRLRREQYKEDKFHFKLIKPIPELVNIDVHSILKFFEEIKGYHYKNYIKLLSKYVWNNYITNKFDKKRLLYSKELKLKEMKESESKEKIIWNHLLEIINYLPNKILIEQKRVIKSIYFVESYPFIQTVINKLKEGFINEEWKELTGQKFKKLLLEYIEKYEIDAKLELDVFESIFPKPFLKNARNKIVPINIEKPFIKEETITNFLKDSQIFKHLIIYQKENKIETLSYYHILCFLFEYYMNHQLLIKNGCLLKLLILPRKYLFQKIQNIRKNVMLEFSKIFDRTNELLIDEKYNQFHQYIKVNHPYYYLYFIAWYKRSILETKSKWRNISKQLYEITFKNMKEYTYFYKIWRKYFE